MKQAVNLLFESILDKLPFGMMLIERNGDIVKTNSFVKAYGEKFSHPIPSNIYRDAMPMHTTEGKAQFWKHFSEVMEGQTIDPFTLDFVEFDNLRTKVTLVPIPDLKTSEIILCCAIFELLNTDIDSPEVERRVAVESKNALSEMNGKISHEFKNILAIISANLETLEEASNLNEQEISCINRSVEACNRGIELSNSISRASGEFTNDAKLIDINYLLFSNIRYWSVLVGKEIMLKSNLDVHQMPCIADSENFKAALTNLLINARDALMDSTVTKPMITVSSQVVCDQSEQYVARITVSDNGPGIPEDMLKKVFVPFMTTKSNSNGTGLGLSITQNLINRMKGKITLQNHKNGGLDAIIEIPIAGNLQKIIQIKEAERAFYVRRLEFFDNKEKLAQFNMAAKPILQEICEKYDIPLTAFSVFVNEERFYITEVGINQATGVRAMSFCNHVLWSEQPIFVNDTAADARFSGHPITKDGIRFYASAPVRNSQGVVIGTLMCADRKPHMLSDDDKADFLLIEAKLEAMVAQYEPQLPEIPHTNHLVR